MSNTKLKEGLGEIAREVAVLPGVTATDASFVGEKVLTISAKIDKTNGMNMSALPAQVGSLNPSASSSPVRRVTGPGILGVLAGLPLVADLISGAADWLGSIGIADHEEKLDKEQSEHSDTLDDLHGRSCECADSVKEIDETADRGCQDIIDVILGIITALKNSPLLQLGSAALGPICDGLLSIEDTVDDRNKTIGECFEGLQQLCDAAGETQPPAPKQYTPAEECPPAPPACPPAQEAPKPAPAPEPGPTTPAQATQPPAPAPAPAPAQAPTPVPQSQPVPECPPSPVPAPASTPAVESAPPATSTTPIPPTQTTVPAATGTGLNVNITVDANLGCPPPAIPAVAETPPAPPAPMTPANCPPPAVPAPPAVPPVGPAGECVVAQVVAGIEAFGQSVAECLSQIECPVEPNVPAEPAEPVEPAAVTPEWPQPEPEPVKNPEPECPEPEPKPEPVAQPEPECPEGTIAPPPELAEVKEPPPPPKKGLVAPMGVGGAEAVPEPEPTPSQEQPAPSEPPAEHQQPKQQDEQHRARKTGGW